MLLLISICYFQRVAGVAIVWYIVHGFRFPVHVVVALGLELFMFLSMLLLMRMVLLIKPRLFFVFIYSCYNLPLSLRLLTRLLSELYRTFRQLLLLLGTGAHVGLILRCMITTTCDMKLITRGSSLR